VDDTPTNWVALHGAIWTLTSPTFSYSGDSVESLFGNGAAGDAKRFAAYYGAWQAFDPTGWSVLTWESPVSGHIKSRQGLLIRCTVPEPETYVLLLSDPIAIFFVARRRPKETGYA
jgi:hypothetical protein